MDKKSSHIFKIFFIGNVAKFYQSRGKKKKKRKKKDTMYKNNTSPQTP